MLVWQEQDSFPADWPGFWAGNRAQGLFQTKVSRSTIIHFVSLNKTVSRNFRQLLWAPDNETTTVSHKVSILGRNAMLKSANSDSAVFRTPRSQNFRLKETSIYHTRQSSIICMDSAVSLTTRSGSRRCPAHQSFNKYFSCLSEAQSDVTREGTGLVPAPFHAMNGKRRKRNGARFQKSNILIWVYSDYYKQTFARW